MTPHYAFLHRAAAVPFVWGHADCALFLADWFQHVHGADPAAHLRGQYHDPGSCQRLCGWFTDPAAVIEGCLDTVRSDPAAFPRGANRPEVGDVAVLMVRDADQVFPAGAVWLGKVWGLRAQQGVTTRHPRTVQPIETWGIGYAG